MTDRQPARHLPAQIRPQRGHRLPVRQPVQGLQHQHSNVETVKRPGFAAASFGVGRICTMPKKIDPAVRERVLRMIVEHRSEYATPTELAKVLRAGNGWAERRCGGGSCSPMSIPAPGRGWARGAGRDQVVEGQGPAPRGGQRDLEGSHGFLRWGTVRHEAPGGRGAVRVRPRWVVAAS